MPTPNQPLHATPASQPTPAPVPLPHTANTPCTHPKGHTAHKGWCRRCGVYKPALAAAVAAMPCPVPHAHGAQCTCAQHKRRQATHTVCATGCALTAPHAGCATPAGNTVCTGCGWCYQCSNHTAPANNSL